MHAKEERQLLRDMGTHGSPLTRVLEAPVKWTRLGRSTTDLRVGPMTLSISLATLEEYRRPYPDPEGSTGLGVQGRLPDHGLALPVGPQIARYPL
jgi:hypothetical protein